MRDGLDRRCRAHTFGTEAGVDLEGRMTGGYDRGQKRDHATMERLRALGGADFDRELAKAMVDGHATAIALATTSQSTVSDPKLRALLRQLLPTLVAHEK